VPTPPGTSFIFISYGRYINLRGLAPGGATALIAVRGGEKILIVEN
jgi:hypothetical protein